MGNLATLAEPFTRENAADMARKATISRENNRRARLLAEHQNHAKPFIEPEINRIVSAMKRVKVTSKQHDQLSKKLKDLWSLAFPTQAAVKSGRSRREFTPAEPIEPD